MAALSVVSDLNDKIGSLSEDRNALEREVAKMQSQLQLEKSLRLESGEHAKVSKIANHGCQMAKFDPFLSLHVVS